MAHISIENWLKKISMALKNSSPFKRDSHFKFVMENYVLIDGELFLKGNDDILLRCLRMDEVLRNMAEVHHGLCGLHQSTIKMAWMMRRHGFF